MDHVLDAIATVQDAKAEKPKQKRLRVPRLVEKPELDETTKRRVAAALKKLGYAHTDES